MKKLLVVALMVVLATPAFAAIQNVKVSGDITSTWLDRQNFDFGVNSGVIAPPGTPLGLKDQNVFFTQTRVRIDADLSDNVSTTVGLVNERAWNAQNTTSDAVDVYLASVTMRELLYSPLTVTIGRQIFTYGNGLVIGNGPGNRTNGGLKSIAEDFGMSTAEDGIKAVLDYKPLTIDLIYYKHAELSSGIAGTVTDTTNKGKSEDVYGINANYQLSDSWNTLLEGYLFTRIDGSAYENSSSGLGPFNTKAKGDELYVPGLRASTNPIKGLNLQGEIAWQLGTAAVQDAANGGVASERRDAMALQFLASYALPVMEKYKPTVNGEFTYVTGDKMAARNSTSTNNKDAKTFTAWDPFDEGQHIGTIYNSLLPLTNLYIVSLGGSVNPLEDVTASFKWSELFAAESYSANNLLYAFQPDSSSGFTTNMFGGTPAKNKHTLGNEYDVGVNYNYTEDVAFGVSLGWYLAGDVAPKQYRNTASQAVADVAVKF